MKNTYLINKPQKDGKAALCAVTAAEWLAAVNANRYLPTEHRRYFIADCIEDGKEIDRMIIEVSYAEYKKWNSRHTITERSRIIASKGALFFGKHPVPIDPVIQSLPACRISENRYCSCYRFGFFVNFKCSAILFF